MSRLSLHKTLGFFARTRWSGAAGSPATPPATVGTQVQDLGIDVANLTTLVRAVT